MAKQKPFWDWRFAPDFTPLKILEMGSFEGGYVRSIKGIPAKYMEPKKVLKERDVFDEKLNYYGIKSRQSLGEWKRKGWITKPSPNGWFEWAIKYCEGRRIEKEDNYQIGRWSSYVSRHFGGLKANCKLDDKKCRPKQRQGLLQWLRDSTRIIDADQHKRNVRKMAKEVGCQLEEGWEEKVDMMYEQRKKNVSVSTESATHW